MSKKKKSERFIEKHKKKIIVIAVAIVLLFGVTYAWLQITQKGKNTTRIEAGTLALKLDEGNSIDVADALPLTTAEGLETEAYTFSVQNTGTITNQYTIYLDNDETTNNSTDSFMEDSVIMYALTKDGQTKTGLVSTLENRKLIEGELEVKNTDTYELRLWIKEDATNEDIQVKKEDGTYIGKVFKAKLRIEASQIKE